MYRGLPCPYGAAVLASTCILTGGNRVMMRVVAMVMVLFMVDQGFYPHDKVLESQAWKKLVYTGGEFKVQAAHRFRVGAGAAQARTHPPACTATHWGTPFLSNCQTFVSMQVVGVSGL